MTVTDSSSPTWSVPTVESSPTTKCVTTCAGPCRTTWFRPRWCTLDAMPLAANQFKVDRKSLPAPPRQSTPSTTYEAPVGPVEELVAEVWCDVLGIGRIGANDNVFELGGNSLDAARVVSKLRSQALDLSLRSVFDSPTIRAMAREILEKLAADEPTDLEQIMRIRRPGPLVRSARTDRGCRTTP